MRQTKIIASIVCAAMVLIAAGCTGEPEPTTVTTQETTLETTVENTVETTVETTVSGYVDPSVTYHAPMSAVSLPAITESSTAKDGTTLFTYTYQNMTLFLQDAPVADAVILDFLNRLDQSNASARSLQATVLSAYAGQDGWTPYSFSLLYQPVRFDEMVLSLFGTESVFEGHERNNTANISVAYDLLTGSALGIRDILVPDYSAEDLVNLIVAGLSHYEKDDLLFPDYQDLISDMFDTNHPAENWYFAQDGLYFYFNPYEIAPYSSGMLISKVPYDTLGGLLKDSYFPAEAVNFTGSPKVVAFSAANTEGISNFAELILDTNGKKYLLYTGGTLLNVRIETGSWSEHTGISFYPEATVFAATAISKGDAVMIQCSDPSSLRLTYESQGQIVSVPLK
jgi:hypothetical protein